MDLNKVEKLLKWGLLGVLVFPLLYKKTFLFPFITTKAYFIYILVDVLFLFYLYLASKKPLWPVRNRLFFLFVIFVGLKFILDAFGLRFATSFWGNYERMMGLFTWLHLFMYFWMLLSVFKDRNDFIKVLKTTVVVSFFVALYGIFQKAGVDLSFILKNNDPRISSTIGNPALLAGYLLIHLYFIAYLFFKDTDKRWRVFYCLVFLADLLVLFFTATRGAILAGVVSVVFMLVFSFLFFNNKKVRLATGVSLFLIILFSVSIFYFKDSSFIKNNLSLSRISNISMLDSTTKSRVLLWGVAWEASRDNALFGVGDNNIRVALDRHYNGDLDEPWFDSSHNQFLDELLAHGWIGLLFYLYFIYFIFKKIFQYRKKDFLFSVIFSGLFVAYLVQNLFLFDTITTIVFFLVFLVFIILEEGGKKWDFVLPGKIMIPTFVILVLSMGLIYPRGISVMTKVVEAQREMEDNIDNAIKIFKEANEKAFFGRDNIAGLLSSNAVLIFNYSNAFRPDQLERLMYVVNEVYKKAMIETSDFSYFYLNLAKIFQSARSVSSTYLDASLSLAEQSEELSPNRIDVYFVRAQGYYFKGKYDKAEEVLKDSLKLGVKTAGVHYKLAEVQLRGGKVEEGLNNISKYQELGGEMEYGNWESFAKVFVIRKDWDNLLKIFLKMDELNPKKIDVYYNILTAYKKLGNTEKIREWQEKIDELRKIDEQ